MLDAVNGWGMGMLSKTDPSQMLTYEVEDTLKYEGNKYDVDEEQLIEKVKNLTEMEALALCRYLNYLWVKNVDENIDIVEEAKKILLK